MARRIGDKATLAEVLASTFWATRGPDTVHESLAMATELARAADEVGDRRLQAGAHAWRLDPLLELADIEAVHRELETLQRLTGTRREAHFKWLLAVLRANHAHLQGRLGDFEALAHDALKHHYKGHDETAIRIFGMQMLFIRGAQGRLDELLESVETLVEQYPQRRSWRCALAHIYAQLECTAQARHELETLACDDFCDLPRDVAWLSNLAGLCEVVAFLGDAPRAQRLYSLLSPYADRCVVAGTLLCQGSASRSLGLLATTLTRYDDAARHFEQALMMNAQIRSPLWIAYTQHDYARMLLLRNSAGDRDKTLELLTAALATAQELGLTALADKTRPLKLTAEVAGPPPAVTSPRSP